MGTTAYLDAPSHGRTGAPNVDAWEAVVRLGGRKGQRREEVDRCALLKQFTDYTVLELGKQARTAGGYRQCLRTMEIWTGKPFWEITSDDLRAFKRESPHAKATKQTVIVAYHKLHEWALLDDVDVLTRFSAKILAVVTPGRLEFVERPPLPLYEARRLLEACRTPIEHRVVFLGLYAGTRIDESSRIGEREWRGDRLVFVGKGAKQRTVPIHPELARVRNEILNAKPASTGVCHSAFARLRDRLHAKDAAGDPAASHALRRTIADYMYDVAEVPDEVVGQILGHSPKVTRKYAPVRFPKMKAAIESVDYYAGTRAVQLQLFP